MHKTCEKRLVTWGKCFVMEDQEVMPCRVRLRTERKCVFNLGLLRVSSSTANEDSISDEGDDDGDDDGDDNDDADDDDDDDDLLTACRILAIEAEACGAQYVRNLRV